ncbi:hypothetical protein C9974_10270 [Marinobacter sp. B9-2]|nr:hypothetical protein C9974_10270 [Marinobacter sp. B9-2]
MRRPEKADLMPWFARALSSAPRYSLQHIVHFCRAKLSHARLISHEPRHCHTPDPGACRGQADP